MGLPDDEIRGVIARAEEIRRESLDGDARRADLEAVIQAAEGVGIPRVAVERALRERLDLPRTPPAVGELTFAKSADGKYYVAEVLAVTRDDLRVRFLRGSEHTVALDEIRPCPFLPGERIVCAWPWWGPWTCTVLSYDASTRRVMVTDGWSETRVFPIEEVWLSAPRRSALGGRTRTRLYAALLGAGAAVGAILGAIATALALG